MKNQFGKPFNPSNQGPAELAAGLGSKGGSQGRSQVPGRVYRQAAFGQNVQLLVTGRCWSFPHYYFFVAELFKETSWIKLLFFDWTILDLYPHHERLLFEALAGLVSAWPEPRCMVAPRRTQVPGRPPEGRSKRSSN